MDHQPNHDEGSQLRQHKRGPNLHALPTHSRSSPQHPLTLLILWSVFCPNWAQLFSLLVLACGASSWALAALCPDCLASLQSRRHSCHHDNARMNVRFECDTSALLYSLLIHDTFTSSLHLFSVSFQWQRFMMRISCVNEMQGKSYGVAKSDPADNRSSTGQKVRLAEGRGRENDYCPTFNLRGVSKNHFVGIAPTMAAAGKGCRPALLSSLSRVLGMDSPVDCLCKISVGRRITSSDALRLG